MVETRRPDPDALLKQAQAEERGRGQLKIFLGYAAGVGKTYAMLEAAQQRKREGVDVVVGYIETHKRAETESMLSGLEIVPRKSVEYHGVQLTEMDVDAVLARQPALVLVDELAHTNAQGSRHPETVPGCGRDPGCRHRRLHHAQHSAPGKPERRGGTGHRRDRARDHPRPRDRRSLGDRGHRSAAGRIVDAPEGGQGLHSRPGGTRHPGVLPQGQPDRPARDVLPARGRARGRSDALVHANARHLRDLAGGGAAAGVHQPEPVCREGGANRPAPGR